MTLTRYIITILSNYVPQCIVFDWFGSSMYYCTMFFWCPCMAINVSVQYNGGLLFDIILLTQCYHHRGTLLNAMKMFCLCSL